MVQRPMSVTVISIIGFGLAALGAVGITYSLLQMGMDSNPFLAELAKDHRYVLFTEINSAIGALMTVFLLVASLGSYGLRKWGRKAMLAYAWVVVAHVLIQVPITMFYVMPQIMQPAIARAIANTPPGPQADGLRIGANLIQYFGVCGSFFGLVYPICVLVFFSKAPVVEAFNGIAAALPSNPYGSVHYGPPPLPPLG